MTPNLTFIQRCPCCDKELDIIIDVSGGETTATLSYVQMPVTKEYLEKQGMEFGSINERKRKTIFNSGVARRLIQLGNRVVDIKPHKENPDKTAFVFEVDNKFTLDLTRLKK